MSTSVFPVLPGLGWDFVRSEIWNNTVSESVSGKETTIANWTYPRLVWELSYDILRSDPAHHEWQDLIGFFNLMQGRFNTFVFEDTNDKAVTAQVIAVGDGVKTAFQLRRTLGGAIAPIFAPHVVTAAKVNGVDPGGWTVTDWSSATPGILTFLAAPGNGLTITADFTYYWPCRFAEDSMTFNLFMTQLWSGKKVSFRSVK